MEKEMITKEKVMEWYIDYVLSHNKRPANVYVFAKENDFSENEFYEFFGNFDALENAFLSHFFDKSMELSHKIPDFHTFSAKEKMLNLYFIFFENLNMNRSLMMFLLHENPMKMMSQLKSIKQQHKEFVQSLDFEDWQILDKAPERIKSLNEKSREETLWLHFVSVMEFWKKDQSPSFEKTTLYIEKTLDTGFDLVENPVIKKMLDLSKFLWKEKFH